MAKVKTTCEIQTYNSPAVPSVRLHSHWSDNRLVEIEIDGKRYVVTGCDLAKAIQNCMNVGL